MPPNHLTVKATGRTFHVRGHPFVATVFLQDNQRTFHYILRNGLFLRRQRVGGSPERRYRAFAPGEAPEGGALFLGAASTMEAVMRIALQHRTYGQPLVVPQRAKPAARRTATVHPGENGVQKFWESADGQAILVRNHGESHWWAMEAGRLVEDAEALERERPLYPHLACVPLQELTVEELVRQMDARFGLELRLDLSKTWRNGHLVPA